MATTIEEIRRKALAEQPFLSRAIYSLTPVATKHVPESITCDSNWNVYYNPEQLASYNPAEVQYAAFRMCREIARLLQQHPLRISRMMPKTGPLKPHYEWIASMASTALANELVGPVSRGQPTHGAIEGRLFIVCDLPGCNDFRANEKVLENVYRTLCQHIPPPEHQDPDQQQSGDEGDGDGQGNRSASGAGSNQGNGSNTSDSNGQPQEPEQQRQSPDGPQPRQPNPQDPDTYNRELPYGCQCLPPDQLGSSADGQKREWELTPEEQSSINEREVRRCVAQSVEAGGVGNEASQGYKQWAKEELIQGRLQPPRDLMSLLKEFSESQAGYEMKRYDGRNRRQGPISDYNQQQIYLPHYYSPKFDLLIVLDTSGSMDHDNTTLGMMYIASVLESLDLHQGAHFYTGDMTPQYQGLLNSRTAREMELPGCGGTNMPNVIKKAMQIHEDQGLPCNLVVCVTDGYSPWDMEPLGVPLVVAITPQKHESVKDRQDAIMSRQDSYQPPEFAEVTVIEHYDFVGA